MGARLERHSNSMKILIAHNYYQQPGGEDQIFSDEGTLLESHGNQVLRYSVHNDDIKGSGKLSLAAATIWNRRTHQEIGDLVARERPDVVHFHNTFPQISPAAYYAARAGGAAVIQNIQNYRLMCPAAIFLRDGQICEDCLGKTFAWPGVMHKCYRGSRAITAVTATMLTTHKLMGTWQNRVDAYLAPAHFVREKLIEGGFPKEKIFVKVNFVSPDPLPGPGDGGYAIFVGRLAPEKGIGTLLKAWQRLGNRLPLRIVGDGPEAERVRKAASENSSIRWSGRQPIDEVLKLVGSASFLVFPSQWYEGQPKVLLEAFARGTPVLASRLGSMTELIDEKNGLLFEPGNADDLASAVLRISSDPQTLAEMRLGARQRFEDTFTADRNYDSLMGIYRKAIAARGTSQTVLPEPAYQRTDPN
jgi:glycosyltransferase involved in cell wall biosynthesis